MFDEFVFAIISLPFLALLKSIVERKSNLIKSIIEKNMVIIVEDNEAHNNLRAKTAVGNLTVDFK